MHLAGNDEMLPNLADYYYLEIFKTSRYVAFVITADQVAHYQEQFYDHLYNLLASSLKYRPTVFLDEGGVLKNFEEFRSFVVDIRGRGHVQIMESLQQRFSNALTNEHLLELKGSA